LKCETPVLTVTATITITVTVAITITITITIVCVTTTTHSMLSMNPSLYLQHLRLLRTHGRVRLCHVPSATNSTVHRMLAPLTHINIPVLLLLVVRYRELCGLQRNAPCTHAHTTAGIDITDTCIVAWACG
jgi:hypothetical protein